MKRSSPKMVWGITTIVLALLLCVLLWQMNLQKKPEDVATKGVNTTYKAKVFVDPQKKHVTGTMEIKAINDTGVDQSSIYFHLYANIFRNDAALTGPAWDYVLGENREPGWIDIQNVQVNGKPVEFTVDQTILEIPTNWKNGKTATIQLEFDLQVPKNNSRFSYDAHAIWLGNWLPIKAVYDEEGWNLDPYYAVGDPFYSEVADYEVQVTVPENYQLATTGVEDEPIVGKDGELTYTATAQKVRDFAMVVMDHWYQVMEEQVGDTKVKSWYLMNDNPENVKAIHKSGVKSLTYFSQNYGKYPYPEYDIVRTGGFFGGMEYPGLVFITQHYYTKPDLVNHGIVAVAHETGHQWWYGLVGNDEIEDPWMDEGLTSYATLRFLLDEYPAIGEQQYRTEIRRLSLSKQFEAQKYYVSTSVENFPDWDPYSPLIYGKGAIMFYQLEEAVGRKKMNEALSHYFKMNQYQNAKTEDLIRAFAETIGPDVQPYFEAWLNGKMTEYPVTNS